MRVLILGSEGFLGSHLANYFVSKNYLVTGCDKRAPAQSSYEFILHTGFDFNHAVLFDKKKYDVCINAAGNGDIQRSVIDPLFDYHSNVTETKEILETISKFGFGCKYIHLSSAAVYGNPVSLPVSETALIAPVSPYGKHKYEAELICHTFFKHNSIPLIILRPFSLFGPGLKKQLFWDVYQKYKINQHKIDLWGEGTETRDYLFIDDFINIADHLIENATYSAEIYNIGSGIQRTIKEVVNLFFNKFSIRPELHFMKNVKEENPLHWQADIKKIMSLGCKEFTDFEKSLTMTSKWMMENG